MTVATLKSITPESDAACRAIATYLQEKINADYEAIKSTLPSPWDQWTGIVTTVRDYNAQLSTHEDFPQLQVFRQGSTGEAMSQCEGLMRYYLPTVIEYEQLPGLFRWMETRISRHLSFYNNCALQEPVRVIIQSLNQMRSQYAFYRPDGGGNIFPLLEISFQFSEIGV